MSDLSEATAESVAGNVTQWTHHNRSYGDGSAEAAWNAKAMSWGQFGVDDASIGSPLGEVEGKDVVELGCGVACFTAWLARRGARPVGVDPTPAQLETARRLQALTGIEFPLMEESASRSLSPTIPSTSAFPDMAPRSAPIPVRGCPRPRARCARTATSCS